MTVPTPTLKRRLADLERRVSTPPRQSELSQLFSYMDDVEIAQMYDIVMRADEQLGNVRAEDVSEFERICLAAMQRRGVSEAVPRKGLP